MKRLVIAAAFLLIATPAYAVPTYEIEWSLDVYTDCAIPNSFSESPECFENPEAEITIHREWSEPFSLPWAPPDTYTRDPGEDGNALFLLAGIGAVIDESWVGQALFFQFIWCGVGGGCDGELVGVLREVDEVSVPEPGVGLLLLAGLAALAGGAAAASPECRSGEAAQLRR